MISFSIVSPGGSVYGTYQAEEGMIWSEWTDSEYNTDGYRLQDIVPTGGNYHMLENARSPHVVNGGAEGALLLNVVDCCGEDVIIADNEYFCVECEKGPGGPVPKPNS